METSTIVWIIVAVVVLLAGIAVAVRMTGRQKLNRQRAKAEEIREQAAAQEGTVRRHEAEAAEQDALARQAQAEADQKAAEAERLRIEAEERATRAADSRAEHQDRLRSADEVDPDVDREVPKHGAPDDLRGNRPDDDYGRSASNVEQPPRSV